MRNEDESKKLKSDQGDGDKLGDVPDFRDFLGQFATADGSDSEAGRRA